MIYLNIPLFIGWILISTATSVNILMLGSFILGFGVGFMESPTLTYIGEITEPNIRGIMTSCAEMTVGIGTLFAYVLGIWFDWRIVAYICSAVPLISILAISLIPESPVWLLAHNYEEKAEKSLCWLRGWVTPDLIKKEFLDLILYRNNKIYGMKSTRPKPEDGFINEITLRDENFKHEEITNNLSCICDNEKDSTHYINDSNLTNTNQIHKNLKINTLISDLLQPQMLNVLLLMLGFFFFNTATGANVAQAYTIPVFKELGFNINPFRANVVTAVGVIMGQLTLMIMVSYLGKRKIVLFSSLGCALACYATAICALYPNLSSEGDWPIPFIIYIVNNYMYGLGLSVIPWMYLSEIFPFRGRGAATGITASVNYLFGFIVTKTFFGIKETLSLAGTFIFYGSITLLGFIYLYFLLPETEGKTLQDIEANTSVWKIFEHNVDYKSDTEEDKKIQAKRRTTKQ
uniref:Major facilitator superfamily (MFS) profile domain-containing protein n=3 Tax=Clastoptera arizonana TaxID=38151 RepID=A0A1B6CBG1_9HEMI